MTFLDPIQLGKHTLKNRTALAPMTTYSSHEDGTIRADEIHYLERRARGGLGMIITAACYVHPSGHAFRGQWGCDHDNKLDSLRSVAEAIQRAGSKAVLQIHHGGRQCPPDLAGGECLSASDVPYPREGSATPRPMTDEEIIRTIDDYAQATRRARQAGFDGVEIHGANTYLIQQFVSPASNLRTDRWNAQDLLFSKLLTEAVLAEKGDMFIGYRFSPEESEPNGITLDITDRLLDLLCQTDLDYLHVSLREWNQTSIRDESNLEQIDRRLLRTIAGRKPLMTVGSIKTGADAQAAIESGAPLVAIGRAAISEPEWFEKASKHQPIRTKLPRVEFAESLTLPAGLAAKIESVPGWFEQE